MINSALSSNTLAALAQGELASSSYCSCDWKNIALLVLAVVGIAASIFTGSIFGIIGFVLSGALLIMKLYENTGRISQIESDLTKTINADVKTKTVIVGEMDHDIQEAGQSNSQMEQQLEKLQQENFQLQALEKTLTAGETKLTQQNQALEMEKADLQRDLNTAQENLKQIRAEIQSFTADNLRLGTETGAFKNEVETLNGTKAKLEQELTAFNGEFDGDAAKLIEQIQIVKNATKEIIGATSGTSQRLERDLADLRRGANQRQLLEQQLQQTTAALDQARSQLGQQQGLQGQLIQKQTELQTLEQQLEEKRATVAASVIEESKAATNELKQEEEALQRTIGELKQFFALKTHLSESLDESILRKQEKLKKIKVELNSTLSNF